MTSVVGWVIEDELEVTFMIGKLSTVVDGWSLTLTESQEG